MVTSGPVTGGSLLYVGIDEAGYGPTLGPLTTAMAAFHVDMWKPGERPPNLWSAMRKAVCRSAAEARQGRIAINDSKQLKLPNNVGGKRHPLTHLERGVLSFLAAGEPGHAAPADDRALLERLGTAHAHLPWYVGEPVGLPLSTTADHVRLLASQLDAARRRAGVSLVAARAKLLPEDLFNQRLESMHSKARVSFSLVEELLRGLFRLEVVPPAAVRIVIDRQGGRTAYAEALARALPKAGVRVLAESARASSYEITPPRSSPWSASSIRVLFTVDAEQDHLPVALASMTAKLTRELAMMRFNRYFAGRVSELKPTAGYALDARRWLEDAGGVLTAEERRLLVRRA